MIKAIILDIDGVIIGEKVGYNSPHPHIDVLNSLKKLREEGVAICLCTAKPYYAIAKIIKKANLHNPHITDAGAVIIDPIDNMVIEKHVLKKELASKILDKLVAENVYVECYTVADYFIQENQASEITQKHTHILQKKPITVSSIVQESSNFEITKIMPIALNSVDMLRVSRILETFKTQASITWGVHPVALPLQFGIVTVLGSSKKEGAETIVESLHISFDEVLGIGDSTSDWKFMRLCGYAATLANGTNELKQLVKSKVEGTYFVSKGSVDENGILDIFKYFSL